MTTGLRSVLLIAAVAIMTTTPAAANPQVAEPPLRAHLAYLADDLLEGRGTGQQGGRLTVRYLEAQVAALGLQPLRPGKFVQPVPITGIKTLPDSKIMVQHGTSQWQWQYGEDVVLATAQPRAELKLDADIVFVGFGISAPEEQWDDYKGVDVKGKIVLMLLNQPKATAAEPGRFGGESLSYYGRWDYKFEEAKRRGAAGVLVLHTDASASYPWRVPVAGYSNERFHVSEQGNLIEGWLHDNAATKLFAAAGLDLLQLRQQATARSFKPVSLQAKLQVQLHSAVRKFVEYNVLAMVPGTDPKLRHEAVVYSAHWDHLGIKAADDGGKPQIWHGAIDNASGAAALLAMAQAAVIKPAKRSQIFFWPCAEEEGLLGSMAFMHNPWWPHADMVANLNLDSMNFAGKTTDMGVPGAEYSNLRHSALKVAKNHQLQLLDVLPDPSGAYFRSDHFSFARFGIPAFRVGSPVFSSDGHFTFAQDHQDSLAKIKAFADHYHQPSDQYDPAWDLTGMQQQAQFTLDLGLEIANEPKRPHMLSETVHRAWLPATNTPATSRTTGKATDAATTPDTVPAG